MKRAKTEILEAEIIEEEVVDKNLEYRLKYFEANPRKFPQGYTSFFKKGYRTEDKAILRLWEDDGLTTKGAVRLMQKNYPDLTEEEFVTGANWLGYYQIPDHFDYFGTELDKKTFIGG